MTSRPRTLIELLLDAAERSPDATISSGGDHVMTVSELAARVSILANGLASLRKAAGERVAIYLPKSVGFLEWLLAASAAGLIVVPVNPVLKPRQIRHLMRDSRPGLLVTMASWLDRLDTVLADFPFMTCICVDGLPPRSSPGAQRLDGRALRETSARALPQIAEDHTAVLFYTSGSSGLPKGVMVSHGNLLHGAESVVSVHGTAADDRILALLPFSFDAGFSQLTTALSAGASLVLVDHLLPAETLEYAAEHRVTHLTGVPPLFHQLAATDWPEALRESMRSFASTGGVMPVALTRRLQALMPRARGFLMYGFTEAFRATILPSGELERRPDSIGLPIPGAELHVLRADGTACAPGEAGELVQAGALVAQGYWGDDEHAADKFRCLPPGIDPARPRAVWSGDIVHRDADGFFYFHHRDSQLIKTSGYRVSPDEVEAVLLESCLVDEAVVVGVPDSRLGESILALVVVSGPAFSIDELTAWCQRELPGYLQPGEIWLVDEIPRSPNGKYDRQAIREAAEQGMSAG